MNKITTTHLDYWTLRAAEILHLAYGQVTKEQRAKTKVFCIVYEVCGGDSKETKAFFDTTIKLLN